MGVSELGGVVAAAARLRVGERERVTGGGGPRKRARQGTGGVSSRCMLACACVTVLE